MVQFSQTSWQEYSLANLLGTLNYAPMKLTIGTTPVLYYTLPQSLEKGDLIKYTLMVGFKKITWTGCIAAVNGYSITVRLGSGPFRGFNAKHEFESDGSLTRCYDEFSFQGFQNISEDLFADIISKAGLVYAIASRKETQSLITALADKKQTQAISALDQSATAG
ncbi:MAG: hypothetical protein MJY82_02185 [Fibrobacter sp.]|nr:hypothetical protein [Fibrobacter sp.]